MNKYDKRVLIENWLSLLALFIIVIMIVLLVVMVGTGELDCEQRDDGECLMHYSNDHRP